MSLIHRVFVLLAACLLVSACSSSEAQVEPAPFDAVLIELFGTDDTEGYLAAVEQHATELVVDCMNDAGFEFRVFTERQPIAPPDPTSLEDAQQMGFGIIADFRDQLANMSAEPVDEDPNLAYLSTLTSAEIQRFLLTLNGVEPAPGQRATNRGCNGVASDAAYADWQRFFEALPNYTALGEERDTHPDWFAARAQWTDCLLDKGFDYSEPDEIRRDVINRMRDSVNAIYPSGRLPMIERDGELVLDPEVDQLLSTLKQFEQAAAVANVECTAPLAQDFAAVEAEVQQGFVDRNRDVIDALLAANT